MVSPKWPGSAWQISVPHGRAAKLVRQREAAHDVAAADLEDASARIKIFIVWSLIKDYLSKRSLLRSKTQAT